MSNIAPLLGRNRAFASDPGAREGMPSLPFIPNLGLYIVICIDCRVDPEVAIIHHTDCGSTLLADDELRHGFAQRIGADERALADTPALDPARAVQTDVSRVLWAPEIPAAVEVSGHVYDVTTGLVTTVVDAKSRK